jgi:hypothetical protein
MKPWEVQYGSWHNGYCKYFWTETGATNFAETLIDTSMDFIRIKNRYTKFEVIIKEPSRSKITCYDEIQNIHYVSNL